VLPTDRRIDLEMFGKVTGRPTTKAAEAEFKPLFPDCAIGTMPPIGHLYGVATYLDRSVAEADKLVFEAGTHSDAIRMKYADYERLARPIVADFAVKMNTGQPSAAG